MSTNYDGLNFEQLKDARLELFDREAEIARRMAAHIIRECDGEAKTIYDFYWTLFGTKSEHAESNVLFDLAHKLDKEARPGQVFMVNKPQRDPYMGFIVSEDEVLQTERVYGLNIENTGFTRDNELPIHFFGSISIPVHSVEKTHVSPGVRPYKVGERHHPLQLASVQTSTDVGGLEARIQGITRPEDIHFGFENVLKVAAEIGSTALDQLVAYQEYTAANPSAVPA